MTALKRGHAQLYAALVIARIIFAFVGTGYIHPDEYFQNGEVTAGRVFDLYVTRTWEWVSSSPVRSIGPPAYTTGIPMLLLKVFSANEIPSPTMLFYTQRASLLLLSFILDACVYRLVPNEPITALLLLASSHVMFTFQLRPFTNSLEAILLAVALLQTNSMLRTRGTVYEIGSLCINLCWLAATCIVGVFTRITFITFVLPILINIAYDVVTRIHHRNCLTIWSWIGLLTPALVAAITTTSTFVALDSFYYRGSALDLVFTPYNFLIYNLSPENLVEHGIHPRWLHVAVNLPMILGPSLLIIGVQAGWHVLRGSDGVKGNVSGGPIAALNKLCASIVISSLHLLSVQPHQEPRFLIPLLVPVVLLAVNSGFIRRVGRVFWVVNFIFNIALSVVFGSLHQGGVVPSLFHVHDLVKTNQNSSIIVYWKTYMPPRHLLAVPDSDVQSGRVIVADLAGASAPTLQNSLLSLCDGDRDATVYLVTPPFALRGLDATFSDCFTADKRIFPHLDLDHVPESIEMGWKDGLSLGIYIAESDCLKQTASRSSQ